MQSMELILANMNIKMRIFFYFFKLLFHLDITTWSTF